MTTQLKSRSIPEIFWYWLFLVTATLLLVSPQVSEGRGLAVVLISIKAACISEQFMGLNRAGIVWRLPVALYGSIVALLCLLIVVA